MDMEMNVEYSLLEIFLILLKRLWMIVLCVIVGTVGTFLVNEFIIEKQYTASVQMYVSPNKDNPTNITSISELNYAQAVVDTYMEILKTASFMDLVAETTDLGYTGTDIKKMMEMSAVNNTEIFKVSITNPDPQKALLIANTIASLAPQKIIEIKNADAVKVVDPARLPTVPTSPKVLRNTAIGAILGLVLSAMLAFLLEMMDRRVKDEDDLIKHYNIPVLGSIPKFTGQDKED